MPGSAIPRNPNNQTLIIIKQKASPIMEEAFFVKYKVS
jgi:hypothetical protein